MRITAQFCAIICETKTTCNHKIEGFDNNVNKQLQIVQSPCSNKMYNNAVMLFFVLAMILKYSGLTN